MLFSIAKRVNLTKLKCCGTKRQTKRIFYYRKLLTLEQCSFNVNIILLYDLAHRIFVKQNHQFPFGQRRRRFAKGEPVNARLRSLSLSPFLSRGRRSAVPITRVMSAPSEKPSREQPPPLSFAIASSVVIAVARHNAACAKRMKN